MLKNIDLRNCLSIVGPSISILVKQGFSTRKDTDPSSQHLCTVAEELDAFAADPSYYLANI